MLIALLKSKADGTKNCISSCPHKLLLYEVFQDFVNKHFNIKFIIWSLGVYKVFPVKYNLYFYNNWANPDEIQVIQHETQLLLENALQDEFFLSKDVSNVIIQFEPRDTLNTKTTANIEAINVPNKLECQLVLCTMNRQIRCRAEHTMAYTYLL